MRPTRKVGAGALAGALATIVVWTLNSYALPADKPITGEIAAALTVVLTFAASWLVSDAPPQPGGRR